MILLDTNVISELIQPRPISLVQDFLRGQAPQSVFTSAVCETEIRYGLARMPAGARREQLTSRVLAFLAEAFPGRILPFDSACALLAAEIRVVRERLGRRITIEDSMIAAIARAHAATIATRNVADFADCGIAVTNPWQPA